jgi:hypothetical protein
MLKLIDRLLARYLTRRGYTVLKARSVFVGSPLVVGVAEFDTASRRSLQCVWADPNNPHYGLAVETPQKFQIKMKGDSAEQQ